MRMREMGRGKREEQKGRRFKEEGMKGKTLADFGLRTSDLPPMTQTPHRRIALRP